jgi:hypothetical protein
VDRLRDSQSSVCEEGGRELELARWLAPRVAWQRRLLELSRSNEVANTSLSFDSDDPFEHLEAAAELVDL